MSRWYRDPELPVPRTDITRFPHAVLEVKLSLHQGEEAPPWIKVRFLQDGMAYWHLEIFGGNFE